jgi:CubicO group peptidase (beta-lactamase class C family)
MRLVLIALAAFLPYPGAHQASAADWGAYKSVQVDKRVERYLARQGRARSAPAVHGMSLAVGVDGELVLARGYGEARPGSPATARTVYHIGSVAKQFTAAAVLSLIESGARAPLSGAPLSINSPIRDVFAGVSGWDSAETPAITVQRLLTMTSALPSLIEHPPAESDPWGEIAAQRMLDELKLLPASAPPVRFSYNNSSYFLLAQLVEATQGSNEERSGGYRDYLRSAILAKAHLRDTGFVDDYAPGTAALVATPFWGPRTPAYRRRPAFVQRDWLKGSADMASSAVDLFLWNKALMQDRILCRSSRALMFADGARVSQSRYYGMGWFIEHANGWDKFSHSGLVPGYSALNTVVVGPHGSRWVSVTLLTNSDGVEDLDKLANDIVQVALQ